MRPLRLTPEQHDAGPGAGDQSSSAPDIESRSDSDLLRATDSGNVAFSVFYRRNVKAILAYFWNRTRDHEATADLTSETFAIAFENVHKFDATLGNGSQWLHGIAANLLKRFWRRNKASGKARRKLEVEAIRLEDPAARELETLHAQLDGDRLKMALQQIPTKNGQAVQLRLVEDLSYDQIAERLGCSPGAARVRVLRGLKHLQHEFDQPTPVRGGTS